MIEVQDDQISNWKQADMIEVQPQGNSVTQSAQADIELVSLVHFGLNQDKS